MLRRIGLGLGLLVLAAVAAQPAAAAEWPPGPRLFYFREGPPVYGPQVISAEPGGERWFRVAEVESLLLGPERLSFSPDGSTLAIGGIFVFSILITSAKHVEPRPLPGSDGGVGPVFSPDGETIAFSRILVRRATEKRRRFIGASVWMLPAGGGRARQLTPWRNGELAIPSSFSPDGTSLAVERVAGGKKEVVLQPVDGGRPRRLAKDAIDASFSPDGSKIAIAKYVRRPGSGDGRDRVSKTDLFVLDIHGRTLQRLTRTPERSEEGPSWDPSGERLAFTQRPAREGNLLNQGVGSSIAEINADGTCRRKVAFTLGLSFHDPVWQPGPGREAGRIEC